MIREDEIQIRWRGMAAVAAVLAAVVFCYPLLLDIPLLDPDEGLHASIAQEMVERGDWVIPRLQGEPFLDKPILYFWAEAFSLRMFGMHEAAVRLPGLMFGLLGAVTTGIVGWRMFGRGVGLVAGMFYGTMILPVALSQAATHDVALVPWVNLALLLFWLADQATTRRAAMAYTLAIGVLLGLSCLTKGLVGVALLNLYHAHAAQHERAFRHGPQYPVKDALSLWKLALPLKLLGAQKIIFDALFMHRPAKPAPGLLVSPRHFAC